MPSNLVIDAMECEKACARSAPNRCGRAIGWAKTVKLNLTASTYTAGGYDAPLSKCIGLCPRDMECLGSIDPYGCKIKPNGIQLVLCFEPCKDGSDNLNKPKLQVWIDGAEAPDGWSAAPVDGEDVCAWVRFIGPM